MIEMSIKLAKSQLEWDVIEGGIEVLATSRACDVIHVDDVTMQWNLYYTMIFYSGICGFSL